MADRWKPDRKFLEFLEWLEKKEGEAITLNGKRVIEEMRRGTEFGKKMYLHFYYNIELKQAYEDWKKENSRKKDR